MMNITYQTVTKNLTEVFMEISHYAREARVSLSKNKQQNNC